MDLIDRNELLKNIDEGVKEDFPAFYNSICAWIMKQKVIDAVEVVRCKDCKFGEFCSTQDSDYCSDGERKDGDSGEQGSSYQRP